MSDENAEASRVVICADLNCARRLAYSPERSPVPFAAHGWQVLEGKPVRAFCPEHAREPDGWLELEVLEMLTPVDMQSPDDVTNAIARLARELDERGGPIPGKPIPGKPAETEGTLLLPLTGEELKGADFLDIGGRPCSLQESSGDRDGVWLGRSEAEGRMFLSPDNAAGIWPHLKRFAETGELTPRPVENHDADPRDRETAREILEAATPKRTRSAAARDMTFGEAVEDTWRPEINGKLVSDGDVLVDVHGNRAKAKMIPKGAGSYVLVDLFTDEAKAWRPLVEGDLIRKGDKIRQIGGGAERQFETTEEAEKWTASHERDPFRGAEILR